MNLSIINGYNVLKFDDFVFIIGRVEINMGPKSERCLTYSRGSARETVEWGSANMAQILVGVNLPYPISVQLHAMLTSPCVGCRIPQISELNICKMKHI